MPTPGDGAHAARSRQLSETRRQQEMDAEAALSEVTTRPCSPAFALDAAVFLSFGRFLRPIPSPPFRSYPRLPFRSAPSNPPPLRFLDPSLTSLSHLSSSLLFLTFLPPPHFALSGPSLG
eukprot:3027999-Pleurochrysis_carterae.AAC.1